MPTNAVALGHNQSYNSIWDHITKNNTIQYNTYNTIQNKTKQNKTLYNST